MRYVTIFVLVALCLALAPAPALAVSGYDSSYASESAFVMINPGETQAFQVVFVNTGTLTWVKGAATQVDLAACLEDKVTCNAQDASESGWNTGWLSSTRYATTTQLTVAPAGFATFAYNIRAPGDAIGTHRFNGDLVVASSGARIHPEGYYQEATVNAVGSTGPAPAPPAPPVNTAELSITKTDSPDPVKPGGNITYTLTANNNSGFDAVNAVVSDAIPANTTFVSFTAPAGWTTTAPGGTGIVTTTKPSFTINTSATFTLVVRVSDEMDTPTTIANTATIKSDTKDPNTANNSASASTTVENFSVSPWAFACGATNYGNPANATDPGGAACDHGTYQGQPVPSYCGENGDLPGTSSASYTNFTLTMTKDGPTCDDMAAGAQIGLLTTLTQASADCVTPTTCNPGGNLRLNVDTTTGFFFVGGTMDSANHITFDVSALAGKTITRIDILVDNGGTVSINNIMFNGTGQ